MDEYRIRYSLSSIEDLAGIRHYFLFEWQDSIAAEKLVNSICDAIRALDLMPSRFQLVERSPWKEKNTHRMIVKNHLVYYHINEEEKLVYIARILSCRQDISKIKC